MSTTEDLKNLPQKAHSEDLAAVMAEVESLWADVVAENERELHLVDQQEAQTWERVRENVSDRIARLRQAVNTAEDDQARSDASQGLIALAEDLARHEHRSLEPTSGFSGLLARLRRLFRR